MLSIPEFCLVVLIGASGAGKSTFARKHFRETEAISSDHCRGLVSDDETDQSVSADAFDIVRAVADKRLKNRRLAVIDATNVRAADRKMWIDLAKRWHAMPVAIVLDPGADVCIDRNSRRPDRQMEPDLPRRMVEEIRRGLSGLEKEGFRRVHILKGVAEIDDAQIEREPLAPDRRDLTGPFDIIGDVHGCCDELEQLLDKLGYRVEWSDRNGEREVSVTPPPGRTAVFVGDLVDRGPRTPDVLRLAMSLVEAGDGLVVEGNHENKLSRWMDGRDVKVGNGLQASIDQIKSESAAFRARARDFLAQMPSHWWLDGGKLCVAHAGLKEEHIGRISGIVRSFALYGETTGETDEFGHPERLNWADSYRGQAAVVYGHVAQREAVWLHETICLDTGCVFGGKLTALRWPERELVSVPAARAYFAAKRAIFQDPPA
ncbi:MAG TPA: AAA family ATPase [Hyphomonadaceae bacterium]|nr:AAA family ATPase [Hyphomonadaceae bacterium]